MRGGKSFIAKLCALGLLLAGCSSSTDVTPTATALSISTTALPGGQVGSAYSAALAASGGVSPLSWSIASGTMPAGLSLSATTGVISGTPTAALTTASLTIVVQDSGSPLQMKATTLALTIAPAPLSIATTSLPTGMTGAPYSAAVVATGGTAPRTWIISNGTLPPGLSIDQATGVISGTPITALANASFTVA